MNPDLNNVIFHILNSLKNKEFSYHSDDTSRPMFGRQGNEFFITNGKLSGPFDIKVINSNTLECTIKVSWHSKRCKYEFIQTATENRTDYAIYIFIVMLDEDTQIVSIKEVDWIPFDKDPTFQKRLDINYRSAIYAKKGLEERLIQPLSGHVKYLSSDTNRFVDKESIVNGNYNERIEGNYIQGNYYAAGASSEQDKIVIEICTNRKSLNSYLKNTVTNLKNKFGFLDIKNNIYDGEQALKVVARKTNFDMSIGFVPTRGEAFVIFAELEQTNADSLREFSARCLKYAQAKTNLSTVGGAVYNFKFPTNLCFAVALVDELDENTRRDVQRINPLKYSVDLLWYEIPVVYELNKKQLFFYERSSDWTDNFTGEIAWKSIRKIILEALIL